MSSILRKRLVPDPTRKITFAVPENLAADVDGLVARAEALGFDVSIEERLEAAYRRIHAKLAKEMKALDVDTSGADPDHAPTVKAADRGQDDEGAGQAPAVRAVGS
ncbi:MAG: hypothetical protein AAFR79_14105 [Pseudomonadota bacterium]